MGRIWIDSIVAILDDVIERIGIARPGHEIRGQNYYGQEIWHRRVIDCDDVIGHVGMTERVLNINPYVKHIRPGQIELPRGVVNNRHGAALVKLSGKFAGVFR